jgi:hypothetical protein
MVEVGRSLLLDLRYSAVLIRTVLPLGLSRQRMERLPEF